MAKVNLWELITTVARLDKPNSEKCQEIRDIHGARFGTELSLEVSEDGTWTIDVFDHEDLNNKVTLAIRSDGALRITRCRMVNDVYENRTVSF